MPKLVKALADGFFDGRRIRKGAEFVVGDNVKVGKWMEVLKDNPSDSKAQKSK